MDALCTVMVGVFCVGITQGDTSVTLSEGGLWGEASVARSGWKADITLHTDNIQSINPAHMDTLCDEGTCVSYFRKCGTPIDCTYVFENPEGAISVKADDEQSMDEARSLIKVAVQQSDRRSISLSRFTKQSDYADPYCHRHVVDGRIAFDAGCEPR
jgi:hypothetical protein